MRTTVHAEEGAGWQTRESGARRWWKYTLFRHAAGFWAHRAERVSVGSREERDIVQYGKDKRTFFGCSPFFDSPRTFLQAETYVEAKDAQEARRKGLKRTMLDLMTWTSELENGLCAFAAAVLPGKRGKPREGK